MNKKLKHSYDYTGLTHKFMVVYNSIVGTAFQLFRDVNGNLFQIVNGYDVLERLHLWDDENRLNAVIGPKQAGFYGYDGNGNRVWKLIGTISQSSQNAGEVDCSVFLDDGILYPTVEEYQEECHAKVFYNSKTQETSWSDEKK